MNKSLAKEDENAELGLIWIFKKPRNNEDNHPLIRPESTLHLAQFTFKGKTKRRKEKTIVCYFFNPTDLKYDLAKQYRIKKLTRSIQKHINAMVDELRSGDKASKMASEVSRSLKDEGHYLAFLYAKIFRTELLGPLDREKREMMQEMRKMYTDFTSGTINQEKVQKLKDRMLFGGGGERVQKVGTTIDNTTKTLAFLVDQLELDEV
ncbi:unnamed protein product, partial [Mesorhabditis belari]|uniref:Uncharacterized protein n=1 Tax=Mesorhabditis belari TaxID=2138241 RepID=A0AAF3J4U5_9BILA